MRYVGTHISRHHGTTIRFIAEGTTALAWRTRIDTPRCNRATAARAADRAERAATRLVGTNRLTIADAAAAVVDRIGVDETRRRGGGGEGEQDGQEGS